MRVLEKVRMAGGEGIEKKHETRENIYIKNYENELYMAPSIC